MQKLFKKDNIMISKLIVLKNAILGYLYKWLIDLKILAIPSLSKKKREMPIVVSMTSYGRRITSSVVYYTLVSVLRQSVLPDRIVLWIDKTEWNSNNLPNKLKTLLRYGVEYEFCDDIKSYTKLIPAIEKYPDSIIVTLDDDIIYAKNTLDRLYSLHMANPNAICCMSPLKVCVKNGYPSNYQDWRAYSDDVEGDDMIFPCGVDSILYPPKCLGENVTNRELFLKLCPLADDIWFWFNGCLNGTRKIGIKRKSSNYSFDALYQYFHQGSALTHTNRFEYQNDMQFRNLFDHYGVTMENGRIIRIQ